MSGPTTAQGNSQPGWYSSRPGRSSDRQPRRRYDRSIKTLKLTRALGPNMYRPSLGKPLLATWRVGHQRRGYPLSPGVRCRRQRGVRRSQPLKRLPDLRYGTALLQRLALPITVGAVRYPGIKIQDPRVIRLLEVLLHGASVAGPPSKSIKPSSVPSISPTDATVSTSCATIYANSKVTVCCSGMDPATPTASPRKASRSRCTFSSSTNGSAVRSPTAASTTVLSPVTSRPASWKPHTTAPTKPSNRSSTGLPLDVRNDNTIVELFVSTIRRGRIYALSRTSPGK
jgi:hypothetical protein